MTAFNVVDLKGPETVILHPGTGGISIHRYGSEFVILGASARSPERYLNWLTDPRDIDGNVSRPRKESVRQGAKIFIMIDNSTI